PVTFVARRDRIGGPAPAALDAALDSSGATLDALTRRSRDRADRHDQADRNLARAFADLTEA
ncbi:MAG: argininosuccinate lyase, partial [Jannaschia sp.]